MAKFDILEDLKWRGVISQETDEGGLRKYLAEHDDLALYCGTDPTGDSLHIEHLISSMILKRLQMAGYHPVILIGGGTGSIGDPSGRKTERVLQTAEQVKHNKEKLTIQVEKLFGTEDFETKNNAEWLGKLNLIDLLRDYGKFLQVNNMINKDVVASRLENGISFTEFSYQILQAIDFYHLNKDNSVQLQTGGFDQWGNVTAGIDLIHKLESRERPAFGLTILLMSKADGTKFGKSAGGVVWLDPEKTSPYELYQFWINQDDRGVVKHLKYFTFLSCEEIEDLAEKIEKELWKRVAQKRLAEEVTKFVHGEEGLKEAQMITETLFSGNVKSLSVPQIEQASKNAPSAEVAHEAKDTVELLVETKIEPSKRQVREDVKNGAIYVNSERQNDIDFITESDNDFDGKYVTTRKGKRRCTLVKIK